MYKCALFGPPRAVVAALTLLTLGPGNRQLTAQTVTSILVESGPNFPRGQTAERLNSGWASRLIMEFGSRRNGIALRIEGNRASFLGDTDTNQFGYVIQYPSLEIDGGRIGVAFSLRAMPKHSLGLHASIGLDRVKKADYQICHPNSGCIVFRERPVGEVVLAGGFSYRVLRFPLQVVRDRCADWCQHRNRRWRVVSKVSRRQRGGSDDPARCTYGFTRSRTS